MINKVEKIADLLAGKDQDNLRRMWNFYQAHTNREEIIYHMADNFSEMMKELSPLELAGIIRESIKKESFDDQLDYFEITRAGYLHSFDLLCFSDYFCYEELAEYIISANDDMGIPSLQKILNEPEIPEYEFKFIVKCKRRTDNVANTMIALKDYIEIQTAGEYDMEVAGCDITKVE